LLPALFFTATSYTCLSVSSALIFRAFGIQLELGELLQIGFVANVITYLMNVGGVTGVSLQFLLLKRRGQTTEDILGSSLFQLYFDGLMLVALLPIGLINILAGNQAGAGSLAIAIAAGILTLLLIGASVIVFAGKVRSSIFRGLGRTFHFITRRNVDPALDKFDRTMTRGVTLIRQRPILLTILLLLMIFDWVSTVTALWFCFDALGGPIGIGKLLTGFSLGITAGFISFIPGGLGVQEGSMAGIYALLGVPIRTAILAAILFRIVYYFLPFLVSLGFYRRLFRSPTT
jgi:uncharacterized protein (TIRG00374 family)